MLLEPYPGMHWAQRIASQPEALLSFKDPEFASSASGHFHPPPRGAGSFVE
jgi:hypothetical protein